LGLVRFTFEQRFDANRVNLFGDNPLGRERISATFASGSASKRSIQTWAQNHGPKVYEIKGDNMSRFLPIALVSGVIFSNLAYGQASPAQSVVSSSVVSAPPAITLANEPAAISGNSEIALDPASLLPDLPSLAPSKATLVGGTVERLDRVQDRVTLLVFGGGKMKIVFDPRTRIDRDGAPASATDLRPGDRIYVDTVLDGSTVFARNIHLKSAAPTGESQGVIVSYRRGELTMRDQLSPHSVKVRLSPSTRIVKGNRTSSTSELVPGTLIAVKFGVQQDGRDLAQEVAVLAVPGSSFTFAGEVINLDLRTGLLVLTSSTDRKTYEIYLDPSAGTVDDNLRQGANVSVIARFDGDRYVARSITVNSPH
jgi:hypothetical protein